MASAQGPKMGRDELVTALKKSLDKNKVLEAEMKVLSQQLAQKQEEQALSQSFKSALHEQLTALQQKFEQSQTTVASLKNNLDSAQAELVEKDSTMNKLKAKVVAYMEKTKVDQAGVQKEIADVRDKAKEKLQLLLKKVHILEKQLQEHSKVNGTVFVSTTSPDEANLDTPIHATVVPPAPFSPLKDSEMKFNEDTTSRLRFLEQEHSRLQQEHEQTQIQSRRLAADLLSAKDAERQMSAELQSATERSEQSVSRLQETVARLQAREREFEFAQHQEREHAAASSARLEQQYQQLRGDSERRYQQLVSEGDRISQELRSEHDKRFRESAEQLKQWKQRVDDVDRANQLLRSDAEKHTQELTEQIRGLKQKSDDSAQLNLQLRSESDRQAQNSNEQIRTLRAKLEGETSEVRRQLGLLEDAQTEMQTVSAELKLCKQRLQERDRDASAHNEERGTIEQLRTDLDARSLDVHRLNAVLDQKKVELSRLQTELTAMSEQHAATSQRLSKELEDCRSSQSVEISKLRQSLDAAEEQERARSGDLDRERAELQSERNKLLKQAADAEADVRKLSLEGEALKAQLDQVKQQQSADRASLDQARRQYEDISQECERLNQNCQQLSVDLQSHQSLGDQVSKLSAETQELRAALSEEKQQNAQLKKGAVQSSSYENQLAVQKQVNESLKSEHSARESALTAQLNECSLQLSQKTASITELSSNLEKQRSSVAALESRISTTTEGTERKLQSDRDALRDVENKLASVQLSLDSATLQVSELQVSLQNSDGDSQQLRTQISQLTEQLGAIRQSSQKQTADMTEDASHLSSFFERFSGSLQDLTVPALLGKDDQSWSIPPELCQAAQRLCDVCVAEEPHKFLVLFGISQQTRLTLLTCCQRWKSVVDSLRASASNFAQEVQTKIAESQQKCSRLEESVNVSHREHQASLEEQERLRASLRNAAKNLGTMQEDLTATQAALQRQGSRDWESAFKEADAKSVSAHERVQALESEKVKRDTLLRTLQREMKRLLQLQTAGPASVSIRYEEEKSKSDEDSPAQHPEFSQLSQLSQLELLAISRQQQPQQQSPQQQSSAAEAPVEPTSPTAANSNGKAVEERRWLVNALAKSEKRVAELTRDYALLEKAKDEQVELGRIQLKQLIAYHSRNGGGPPSGLR